MIRNTKKAAQFLVLPIICLCVLVSLNFLKLGTISHRSLDIQPTTSHHLQHPQQLSQEDNNRSSTGSHNGTTTISASAEKASTTTTIETIPRSKATTASPQQPQPPKITRTNNNNEPLFIIHPGPPKTATTTIQNGLKAFRSELKEDGFLFPGMMDGYKGGVYEPSALANLQERNCQQRLHNKEQQCWKDFCRELEKIRQTNTSIIISDERLAELWWDLGNNGESTRIHWPTVTKALEEWDVCVLLSYRRLEEWLPSVKAEYDRMGGNRKWPDGSRREIQPLFPSVMNLLQDVQEGKGRYKGIATLRRVYERHFPNSTVVWDLASSAARQKGVLPTLLCDILEGASSACNASLHTEIKSTNARKNFELHRIVGQAAMEGLIHNSTRLSRQVAAGKLQKYHRDKLKLTDKDWPLECPNRTTLEVLLNASLQLEQSLLPGVTKEDEQAHRNEFWKTVENKKYCSVNATAVLRNETYAKFFASLS